MFDSISKVWNEVSEESNDSVNFVPSERRHPKRSTHYIHYDKVKPHSALNRIMGSQSYTARRHGSPRILKPSTDQKKNTFWGSIGKMITGGGDKKDNELGNMKSYMSGMIRKRPREMSTTSINSREREILELRKDNSRSELQQRVSSINERAEKFANDEDTHPDFKRIRRLQSTDFDTSREFNDNLFLNKSINNKPSLGPQYSSTPKGSVRSAINNRIVKLSELPSSPFAPINHQQKENNEPETATSVDESLEKINELSTKVEMLESTVRSLREELKLTNDRSLQLEQSIRLNSENSFLPNNTQPVLEPEPELQPQPQPQQEDEEFEDISRPMSPVQLDLSKFKLIR